MEQRLTRLKTCLAHIQRQFGHMTAVEMPDEVRDYLGAMWQHVMHMQLEVAALERQHGAALKAKLSSTMANGGQGPAAVEPPLSAALPTTTIDQPLYDEDVFAQRDLDLKGDTDAYPASPRQGATAHSVQQNRAILVIDDCQNTQNILSFSLSNEGLDITSLTEPERWVSAVRQVRPQVILLDLMMPGMDGFEVLRQLRSTKDFDSIFVVVGSSRSFEHDRLAVLGMGADDFIPKPYHIKELALKFNNLIRSVRRYS